MLKIRIIVVDRTRAPFLRDGESFYMQRLQRYVQVDWVEVKPAKIKKGIPDKEVLLIEGEAIARRFLPRDYVVALDRTGASSNSEELAAWLDKLALQVDGCVCFIIGGPLGLSEDLLRQAHKVLSLSSFTLTHEMSRLLLLEQLYRAFTILRGEKYHK